jgi:hypothetical protein
MQISVCMAAYYLYPKILGKANLVALKLSAAKLLMPWKIWSSSKVQVHYRKHVIILQRKGI